MRLYGKYLSMHLRAAMQHKASFAMLTMGQFLVTLSSFAGVWFLFDRFSAVEGYTFQQVLLCFAINIAAFTLAEAFFRGFDRFPSMLSNGEFDRALTRPRGLVFQVLCSQFELTRFSRLVYALAVLAYALPTSGIVFTPDKIACLLLMLAGGTALYAGLFVVYATVAFFTIESIEFMNIFLDGAREFGAYPWGVYGRVVLKIVTFLVPLACVQYWPLLYLLGRAPSAWFALLPLAGFVFWVPAFAFWRFGVRRFKSTGS